MASKISINLDTSKENYILTTCKQDDDLTLEASIYENGLALDLTNKEIFIKALKADNTYINQSTGITKENNKVMAELVRDFSRVPGTTKIELALIESGKQNTTFSFYLEVVASVIKGAVESNNTVTILEELDNKVLEAGQVKQETEQLIAKGGAATKGDIDTVNAHLEQNTKQVIGLNTCIEIDINKMKIDKLGDILNIPCYTGNEAVHPSVLYLPNGWNGYKYWMAFTPYQNSNNQVENPSIVCSNNGKDWIVPSNVINPLVPTPINGGKLANSYNSDPMLFMDKDNITMHIVYRECFGYSEEEGNERLYLISSNDGWKTVTEPKAILLNKTSLSRPVCPAIRWNGEEYLLWYVDIVPTQRKLYVRKSKTLDNWSEQVELSIWDSSIVNPWHFDIHYYNGYYYMLMQGGGASGGDLFLAKSINGIEWIANNNKINLVNGGWNNKPYKGTILPINIEGGVKFALWLSSMGSLGWKTGYIDIISSSMVTENSVSSIATNKTYLLEQKNNLIYAINKIPPFLVADTFDRSNTTNGLGATNTGQVWLNDTAYFIVKNNFATPSTNSNAKSYLNIGYSNARVSMNIQSLGTQLWIMGRMSNIYNYIRIGTNANGTILVQEVVAGAPTTISSVTKYINSGDILEVDFKDNSIFVKLNGEIMIATTSSLNTSSTMFGIQATTTETKIKNIIMSYLDDITETFSNILMSKVMDKLGITLAINKILPYVLGDTFNRVDNTSGLGTSTSGQVWANNVGVMAVKNGKASPNSDTNTRALADVGLQDLIINCKIPSMDTQAWIIFRFSNDNNLLRAGFLNSNTLEIQKVEGGSASVLASSTYVFQGNELIEVKISSNNIELYVNGDRMLKTTSSFNLSSTIVGLQATKVGTSFDDFTVRTL